MAISEKRLAAMMSEAFNASAKEIAKKTKSSSPDWEKIFSAVTAPFIEQTAIPFFAATCARAIIAEELGKALASRELTSALAGTGKMVIEIDERGQITIK